MWAKTNDKVNLFHLSRQAAVGGVRRSARVGRLPALLSRALALPVILVVRLLRPVVLIRFGGLGADRIGHFARNVELYLCERDVGMQDPRAVDFFFYIPPVCNHQLKRMFDRILRTSPLIRPLEWVNHRLPGGNSHSISVISAEVHRSNDMYGLLSKTSQHLSFTDDEEHAGRVALRQMGIPDGAPFVCFQARDPAFLNATFPGEVWSGHSFRDSNIHNYLPAMEELSRRGYFALRMGAIVAEELKIKNPRIIDYATKFRSEFLDIYLAAKCRFFVSSGTGLDSVSDIFRRPVAFVNYTELRNVHYWKQDDLTILKKLWLTKEQRFLTFREILSPNIGRLTSTEDYSRLGIEAIENTPEEITALVVEIALRLSGQWLTNEPDEELQQRFWSLLPPGDVHGTILARIGAEFLRENRALLE